MERIGVLGGTFDPPHLGHLAVAEAAICQLALDAVLWVPAGDPPHKHHQTPIHHRLDLVRLTIANDPRYELDRTDVDRAGPHYSADMLELLQAEHGPGARFWLLIGEDSLRSLPSWHAPDRILAACRLAVYPRSDRPHELTGLEQAIPGVADKVDWLRGPTINLSSRLIRRRVREGQPIRHQVPAAVAEYLVAHQLYLDPG